MKFFATGGFILSIKMNFDRSLTSAVPVNVLTISSPKILFPKNETNDQRAVCERFPFYMAISRQKSEKSKRLSLGVNLESPIFANSQARVVVRGQGYFRLVNYLMSAGVKISRLD